MLIVYSVMRRVSCECARLLELTDVPRTYEFERYKFWREDCDDSEDY